MPAWLLFLVSLAMGVPVAWTIVQGRARTRHERARLFERELANELLQQASGLDRLVSVLGTLADSLDGERVLEQASTEARRLLDADHAVLLHTMADGTLRPLASAVAAQPALAGLAVTDPDTATHLVARALGAETAHATPLAAHGELVGVLVVARDAHHGPARVFSPAELAQLRVLADFASRAAQNARLHAKLQRLKDEAERRERERARLSNQLAEAEQSERRRLAMLLHDGPQQTITSAALLLDACIDAIDAGDTGDVHRMLGIARQRNREAVRDLRELSFSLEPPALRDDGLTAALMPLCEKLGDAHSVRFELALEAAERLDHAQQTFVYQIIREAVANAIKHAKPTRIAVLAADEADGSVTVCVRNDGPGISRLRSTDGMSQGMDAMRERAAAMGGRVDWAALEAGGTEVRLLVPPLEVHRAA
jgi:signal transduction histidine kinase